MYIVSFVFSIIAIGFCWMPFWSIPVSLIALILSIVAFNMHFISDKKDTRKKGKSLVFAALVLSVIAMIGSFIMVGIPLGIFLLSY